MPPDHTTAIFAAELILLLLVGRLLGEGMTRIGQPAIFGQLLAGVLLGPSIFGALFPELRAQLFPDTPVLKSMIKAVSEIGILLLLLLTGMETNLALVNRNRRVVVSSSLFGIVVPFVSGLLLASLLPGDLFPNLNVWFVSALFLGTALSISSVKIVAMVLMEVGAIRRDLGQLILATAILDDTVAWILIAVIAGLAAHGTLSLLAAGTSVAGVLAFLFASFTIGRRAVASIIRWTNDNLLIEVPVITAILAIMLLMALATELIGVHTALGAFVAGILVGQSPILTEHIEDELRGFIIAFFSPVFFAVAGLGLDLRTLLEPTLLGFTLAIIVAATLGKFLGAFLGGRLGGLTGRECVALGTALNARGSTEVIIAAIGLSMGVLSTQLYTMIVAMAVITTMIMPPTLRWMLARVPLREEEARRLQKEDDEAKLTVPKMERALVVADASPNGLLAAQMAGTFCAGEALLTTVIDLAARKEARDAEESSALAAAKRAADAVARKTAGAPTADVAAPEERPPGEALVRGRLADAADAIEKEVMKGYSIAFAGVEGPLLTASARFAGQLHSLVQSFDRPIAIALNARFGGDITGKPLNIMVPTAGERHARLATEVALALGRATGGRVTVFHVFNPQDDVDILRGRRQRGLGASVLQEARRLGKTSGVTVEAVTTTNARPDIAIRREVSSGSFDIVVVGAALRLGETKFLGPRTTALVRGIKAPILLIVQ
jgi:Kef-type K+ transport system membrane component KefB/nucleotide-binding universal stress UspA family protein